MTWKPCVLVVAPTPRIATTLFAWLTDAGCAPFVVSSFASGKQHLEDRPCFLISEIRLGEYNGLHLALRAQSHGIPVVLIGEPDSVLEREAAQLGAVYLPRLVEAQELLGVLQPIVQAAAAAAKQRSAAAAAGVTFTEAGRADLGSVSFVSAGSRTRALRHSPSVRS